MASGGPPDEANKTTARHSRQVDLAVLDLPSRFQNDLAQAGGKIKETSFNKNRLSTNSDSERPIVKRHLLEDARRMAQNRTMREKSVRIGISNKGAFGSLDIQVCNRNYDDDIHKNSTCCGPPEPEFLNIYWWLKSRHFEERCLSKGQNIQQGSQWLQFLC